MVPRSWLTRLNSTPAAPPTPETGGGDGRGRTGGRTGAGRAATGAAAGSAAAITGVGVGGGIAGNRPKSLAPEWRDCSEAIGDPAVGRMATGRPGCEPRMLIVATATSGPPTIKTSRVTERDNSESPLWSDLALEDSRSRPEAGPNRQAPEKPVASIVPLAVVPLSSRGGDEEEQLTEQLARQDHDHGQVEEAGGGHEGAEAAGRQRQPRRQ